MLSAAVVIGILRVKYEVLTHQPLTCTVLLFKVNGCMSIFSTNFTKWVPNQFKPTILHLKLAKIESTGSFMSGHFLGNL